VKYRSLEDLHSIHTRVVYIDRHWSGNMRCATRNDKTGVWDFVNFSNALPPSPPIAQRANFMQLESVPYPSVNELIRSFVRVECTMPLDLEGFPETYSEAGQGLVVDAEEGLVVVSRAVVPHSLCDIAITIADSVIVEGKVVFLHPSQNYAIIQYAPSLVDAPVQSARLSTSLMKQGYDTIFVGFDRHHKVVVTKTTVTQVAPLSIASNPPNPRYRAVNVDAIYVDTNSASRCGNGVLVSEDGTVQALWLTYIGEDDEDDEDEGYNHCRFGFSTTRLLPVISQIRGGVIPMLRILSAEFYPIQMRDARIMGVSDGSVPFQHICGHLILKLTNVPLAGWITRVEQNNVECHQLFKVGQVHFDGQDKCLEAGDLILSLNGNVITRLSELDVMYNHDRLDVVIVRNGQEMEFKVPTVPTKVLETHRAILFCGAVLHRPHYAVRQQHSKLPSDIYVSSKVRYFPL
jgi:hypothetical protein